MTGYPYTLALIDPFGASPLCTLHSDRIGAHSLAFVCPYCGDLWGRIAMNGQPGDPPWTIVARHCHEHGPYGGSFIYRTTSRGEPYLDLFATPLADLPIPLVRYELSIAKV